MVLVSSSPSEGRVRVYLVRHGRASAGWDTDPDPGLDETGRAQAEETAQRLSAFAPTSIVSSPLRRCQETASFLARSWAEVPVVIEPLVAEIPSPPGIPMAERVTWLRAAMAGSWADLGAEYRNFRNNIVTYVSNVRCDTVIFSHFIAINAVIGHCLGDDRVVIDSLDNASVTIVDVDDAGRLHLVERGRQANTLIR